MRGATRAFTDFAGGMILPGSNTNVRINNSPAAVVGSPVVGHGRNEHAGPIMITGSPNVRIGGIPVCRSSDIASCGHAASGSNNVRIN